VGSDSFEPSLFGRQVRSSQIRFGSERGVDRIPDVFESARRAREAASRLEGTHHHAVMIVVGLAWDARRSYSVSQAGRQLVIVETAPRRRPAQPSRAFFSSSTWSASSATRDVSPDSAWIT
jgi:hypothetical protein